MADDSEDERLLGVVASALVAIDEIANLTTLQMPYPPVVQRALDRIALHCLRRHASPPNPCRSWSAGDTSARWESGH